MVENNKTVAYWSHSQVAQRLREILQGVFGISWIHMDDALHGLYVDINY